MRIVQLANFHAPTSGGIRTALEAIGAGYRQAGHERVLIVPGRRPGRAEDAGGTVLHVRGARLRRTPYRCIVDRRPVHQLLDELRPDVVEVSDKLTLRWVGRWARRHGVAAVLFSHERIDAALAPHLPTSTPLSSIADRWNRKWADDFDAIVCCSAFAAEEFTRIGAQPVRVPLGVDLERFRPLDAQPPVAGPSAPLRLVVVARLSAEKEIDHVVEAVRVLGARGRAVDLQIAGAGPRLAALRRQATDLPIRFVGHQPRPRIAELLGTADVAIAPGPAETFGLAALEALACGTPVVVRAEGGCRELIDHSVGVAAVGRPDAMATAIETVAALPREATRLAARRRAEQFSWATTVSRLLSLHHDLHVRRAVSV
ncbi:MAG: glycosyltransferase [Actinomycetota bacterium]